MRSLRVLLLIGTLVAAGGAAITYWATRSDCVEHGAGLRGEAKVLEDGRTLYFNGTCWTGTPQPPRDMPF